MSFTELIHNHLENSAATKRKIADLYSGEIEAIGRDVAHCLLSGGKILLCGNGGSASDSEHIAAEFVGRFRRERRSLPAISLTIPGSLITAIGNDYGYEQVFSRQVEGQGTAKDMLFCFSTSGNSPSVIRAAVVARTLGLKTVGFTGQAGGALANQVDLAIRVPSTITAHIQESHITIGHMVCEIADELIERAGTVSIPLLPRKVQSLKTLVSLRRQWKAEAKTVVWSNGCFDLLHNGHVRNLQDAKAAGDILIVGVNSDESVKTNKGPKRPVQSETDRAEMIAALGCVDYVTVFSEKTPIAMLEALQPDIHCKGEDYADNAKPMDERATVEAYGGRIHFLKLHPGFSTTGLIERIRQE